MKPFYAIALILLAAVPSTQAQISSPGGLSGVITPYNFSTVGNKSYSTVPLRSIQHTNPAASPNPQERIMIASVKPQGVYQNTNQLSRYFAKSARESIQGNTTVDARTARIIAPTMDLVHQLSN